MEVWLTIIRHWLWQLFWHRIGDKAITWTSDVPVKYREAYMNADNWIALILSELVLWTLNTTQGKTNFCTYMYFTWYNIPTVRIYTIVIVSVLHYSDGIMGAMGLKSPASRLFTQPCIQAQIKENIKAPRNWLCAGNSPVAGEFPVHIASNAEFVFPFDDVIMYCQVSIWSTLHRSQWEVWLTVSPPVVKSERSNFDDDIMTWKRFPLRSIVEGFLTVSMDSPYREIVIRNFGVSSSSAAWTNYSTASWASFNGI